eukprot:gene15206-10876_t
MPPQDVQDDVNKREIDGFYLLEVSGTSFPEDLQHIVVSDRKLKTVVDEDLTYFSELQYVDVSENFLPLFPFGALPKLRELRIACNRIHKIEELFGFNQLMYLDMSYNQLQYQCIEFLYDLPLLKELDLSGNGLRHMPTDLFRFESLEKLILQYNKFDDNQLFRAFGTMPVLRCLDVSNNFFSSFPSENMDDSFKFLDTLDISFNFFGNESDIVGVVFLNRLETFLLYGNPVLGPTGEDPMFIYIEDVVDQANDHRDKIHSTISYIDFVTEIPKKRVLKKGEPLGRLALYRDFSIVQVDSRISSQSNREWRRKGIQTIFGEMMAGRRHHNPLLAPSTSNTALVPDYTFITNAIATSNNFTAYQKYAKAQLQPQDPGNPVLTQIAGQSASNVALNEADRNAIADAVMRKVVTEMELTGEDDLRLFESYAKLPPTVVEAELRRALTEDADAALPQPSIVSGESSIFLHSRLPPQQFGDGGDLFHLSVSTTSTSQDWSASPNPAAGGGGGGGHSPLHHLRSSLAEAPPSINTIAVPRDHLPEHLFQPTNIVHPLPTQLSITAQPIALKTAMKALQRALDQPLTNYDAVPSRWSVNEHDYGRHTLTSKIRQQPRIPLTATAPNGGGAPATDGAEATRSAKKPPASRLLASAGQRGLAEPVALKKVREEARDRTMAQIDFVLQSLNESTQRLTTMDHQDAAAAADGGGGPKDDAQGIASVKQSMEKMRYFARPQPGVQQVLHMARDILDEFH